VNGAPISATAFRRLYWGMRLGIAFIWLWTAYVSWYVFPHAESLAWLRRSGMTYQTGLVFAASCLLDLAMGIASCLLGRAWLWWAQCALVAGYTVVIAIALPEFLVHPFGPIIKNVAVLACLVLLALAEKKPAEAGCLNEATT
jgi:hypothetical protein